MSAHAPLPVRDGVPTRACSVCRGLRRSDSWSWDGGAPPARKALVHDAGHDGKGLLRCPECAARYVTTYWSEVDVNSMHEEWTLRRLTLGEIRREHGPDLVPDWTAALEADLDHPDAHWRIEAAHDLVRDHIAARRADFIENALLRHPRADVVQETLRTLGSHALDTIVSTAALEAVATSGDEETRALATRLLVMRRGPGVLEDLELRSSAELWAVGNLLSNGAVPGPRLAARALERALTAATPDYEAEELMRRTAFADAHLPTTRARLCAALAEPSMRSRALSLCLSFAQRTPIDADTLAAVLQHGAGSSRAEDRRHAQEIALTAMEHMQVPSVALEMLSGNDERDARIVVQQLSAAHDRKEDVAWAVEALGAAVHRHRDLYEAAQLLWQLAKSSVDVTPAVRALGRALDKASSYGAEAAARALVHHHANRNDVDGVLAVLGHRHTYVRGAAAAAVGERKAAQPQRIVKRLREMTAETASRPREAATTTLRILQPYLSPGPSGSEPQGST